MTAVFFSQPVPSNTPLSPIVVEVPDTAVTEIGVIDILLGSLGITGLILVASALMGFAVAAAIFWIRRRSPEAHGEGASLGSAQLGLTLPRGTSPRQAP